jgi:hypothetical protein
MAVLKQVTKYIVFAVTFSVDERHNTKAIYFAHESDAKRCADLKRGWYGSTGNFYSSEFGYNDLPNYFEDFNEWAEETLTVKQYKELILRKWEN